MKKNPFNLTLYRALEPNPSLLSKITNSIIIIMILISVISTMIESDPVMKQQYQVIFYYIEIISITLFTIEYIARIYCAPLAKQYEGTSIWKARCQYMCSFYAVIDLLAIAPFLFSFVFDLRILRIVRLLRVFKLTRYNSAMNTLFSVLKQEANAFLSVIFVLTFILIIAATGVYHFEREAQPEHFGSIIKSMWWAMVTLTTVGYGDVFPITPLGKLFSAFIMIVGIGLVALPAGILASGFSDRLHQNKEEYRLAVEASLKDGKISPIERELLKKIQIKCNLSNDDARKIEQSIQLEKKHISYCPHCNKRLEQ